MTKYGEFNMSKFFKEFFKLNLTAEEQRVLDALNSSDVISKRVVGRGTLTVKVSDITSSDKFKSYSAKASTIVSCQNN